MSNIIDYVFNIVMTIYGKIEQITSLNTIMEFVMYIAALVSFISGILRIIYDHLTKKALLDVLSKNNVKRLRDYVTTYAQSTLPTDASGPDEKIDRFDLLHFFIKDVFKKDKHGRYFIILADSGMGKSTFLHMLFFKYKRKIFKQYDIYFYSLTNGISIDTLENIKNKNSTILLLDALDEDSYAENNYGERIQELLKVTQKFYKVIITCRTQFFPDEKSEPKDTPLMNDDTRSKKMEFYKIYLSRFSDDDINRFLKKRFKAKKSKILPAYDIIQKCPDMMARPMILSFIDELLERPTVYSCISDIYKELVEMWIEREGPNSKLLKEFSKLIMLYMFKNNLLYVTADDISALCKKREIEFLNPILARTRSLLTRDSRGKYSFAHKSIYEYMISYEAVYNDADLREKILGNNQNIDPRFYHELSIKYAMDDNDNLQFLHFIGEDISHINFCKKNLFGAFLSHSILTSTNLISTDLSRAFLSYTNLSHTLLIDADLTDASLLHVVLAYADLTGASLNGANLTSADLSSANLSDANLIGTNLTDADLTGANLTGVDLTGADLTDADLTGANLTDANLSHTVLNHIKLSSSNLTGADLTGADLTDADLTSAYLADINLNGANLTGANLTNTNLTGADLTDACLTGADLTGADLTGADLTGIDLTSTNLAGINLTGAILTDINLTTSNLNGANLTSANLIGADLIGTDLTGADLTGADLTNADLNGANLTGANLTSADLTGADLTGINLIGADLTSASLINANLTSADLSYTKLTLTISIGADLTGAVLSYTNLIDANLTDTVLTGAVLTNAFLDNANLTRANLTGANLTDTVLAGAVLTNAVLKDTNLTHTNLRFSTLINVKLSNTGFHEVDIEGTNIDNETLRYIYANTNVSSR